MKVLIVAGYFPPYSPASASRVNKLSKYLVAQGHDVKVLAPRNEEFDPILTPEIDPERIIYTDFNQVNNLPGKVKNGLKNLVNKFQGLSPNTSDVSDQDTPAEETTPKSVGKEGNLSKYYRAMTNIPDSMIGWYSPAVKAGYDLFRKWSPDVIFATAPPQTTILVASRLAKIIEVPWICDYRDLWTDHPYYGATGLRLNIDRFLENTALKNCAGYVTVTETWANLLAEKRGKPVACVLNGFDPADFEKHDRSALEADRLNLLYAGYLYAGKRDPGPLLKALHILGDEARKVCVTFHLPGGEQGLDEENRKLVEEYQLQDSVKFYPFIPQAELLARQSRMDILLLLRWDNPQENGVIAGKLFEYIGAGKEILSVGSTTGEAADIIRDNDFGHVSNDPEDIADYLKQKIADKEQGKLGEDMPAARDDFARDRQFEKLEAFMAEIIAG